MIFTPEGGGAPQQFTIYDFKGKRAAGLICCCWWWLAWPRACLLCGASGLPAGPMACAAAGALGWQVGGHSPPAALLLAVRCRPSHSSFPPAFLSCALQGRAWRWACTTQRSRSAALQSRASSTRCPASGELACFLSQLMAVLEAGPGGPSGASPAGASAAIAGSGCLVAPPGGIGASCRTQGRRWRLSSFFLPAGRCTCPPRTRS